MAEKMVDRVRRLNGMPPQIRNIGVCAHIDHGKTTFSDNLLAGAGMISKDLAGELLVLDFHEDEQERGITIDSANVSMVHEIEGEEFLINLIDTPGHIDFSGDVTRAMRAVDGAIVLCDAVEGIMPQTETVLRQALRERVKPVLFINKVDRLIRELKLEPQAMQERFVKIIQEVNTLINALAEDEFKGKWDVSVEEGSVAFGSAIHNWALSFPYMKATGMTFQDVIDAYKLDEQVPESHDILAEKAPLHVIVLDMVVDHHPNPVNAQKYRIPKIWRGELESEMGKALINCDPKGQVGFICTKIVVDKHAGEIAAGRLFSGTVRAGDDVWMSMNKKMVRLQQVVIYNGPKREMIDEVPAGNILGLSGLKNVFSGETISTTPDFEPFESIKHLFEAVVTKAIEAKRPTDLPKLIEVLRVVNKEDPTLTVEINEETGEHLISGMGELHLEVIENRIISEKGVEVQTSPPIVVYRETVTKKSPQEFEGKSPNKHNKLKFIVEPLADNIRQAIKEDKIPSGRIKKVDQELVKKFVDLGMDTKEARKIKNVFNGNILVDKTRGEVHINEIMELVNDMFEDVMNAGPVAREKCTGLRIDLVDTKLHEDTIHRGPGQMYPAVRDGIRGAISLAQPFLLEPIQTLQFEAPSEYMGELSKLISNKRGYLMDMKQTTAQVTVKAKMPVGEMFGMTSELRSATSGRGVHFLVDQSFEKLPENLQNEIITKIRQRKGLKLEA